MAEDKANPQVRLINRRTQPVELHLGPTVRVLAAGQGIELDATLLALPQVAYLLHRKAIAVHATAPPPVNDTAGTATTPRRRSKRAATPARPSKPSKRKKGS